MIERSCRDRQAAAQLRALDGTLAICHSLAPSIDAASYSECGIVDNELQKISML